MGGRDWGGSGVTRSFSHFNKRKTQHGSGLIINDDIGGKIIT